MLLLFSFIDIVLPEKVSDGLFQRMVSELHQSNEGEEHQAKYLNIFCNAATSRLSRIRLNGLQIDNTTLCNLLQHGPIELGLVGCVGLDASKFVESINHYGKQIKALFLSEHQLASESMTHLLNTGIHMPDGRTLGSDYLFLCPNLRVLAVQRISYEHSQALLKVILTPLTDLICLDLSDCELEQNVCVLISKLKTLTSLTLHNVSYWNFKEACQYLKNMKQLK